MDQQMRADREIIKVTFRCIQQQGPQELLFTGMRTSGELLVVRMVRAEQRQAQIQIVLRDSKNRVFVSGENGRDSATEKSGKRGTHILPLDISSGNKFQVSCGRSGFPCFQSP